MNPSADKLVRKFGIAPHIALALIEAGFRNSGTIKRASLGELQKVRGVGVTTARKLKRVK